uniref:Phosphatase/phosphohexomutase HAD superfamily n=1 Tax=uncultured organism TaxID=155900 RepID=E3T311_9ZZZZ|nr:phosphatase/phosphohexomutase HAD superfamily [uncultured organism]
MESIGLDIKWTWEEFKAMLHIPGSKNRLKLELEKLNLATEKKETYIKEFEFLKKNIYIQKYLPEIKLREGVKSLIDEAIQSNIRLAIVSTSYESQIISLLNSKLHDVQHYFEVILGKESGKKTANNGYLYKKCLQITNCSPGEVIVIEDSEEGLEAAVCAGISTAVFYNDYTFGSAFKKAKLVAPSLKHFNLKKLIDICLE